MEAGRPRIADGKPRRPSGGWGGFEGPDGKSFYYYRDQAIWRSALTGENEVRVADNPESQDFRVRGNSLWVLNNSPPKPNSTFWTYLPTSRPTSVRWPSALPLEPQPALMSLRIDDKLSVPALTRSKATSCWSRISTETPESRANRKFLRAGNQLWEVLTIRSMFRWNRYG